MSFPRFTPRIVTWHEAEPDLRAVRGEVFVQEQGVPEDLVTGLYHQPIATGRLLIREGHARIGRLAVLPAWRGQGVGTAILKSLLNEARRHGVNEVVLHAQATAVPFYEHFDFVRVGDKYLEAGIPHFRMTLDLG